MFIINVQPTGYLYTSNSSSTVPGIKLSSTLWYYPAIPASDYLYTFFFLMECLPRFSGSLSHYPWHCVWNGACHESGYYTPKCFHCIRCPQCVGWSWLCNRDLTRSSDIRVMCIYISTDTVSLTKAEPEPGLKDDAPTNSFRQTNRFYVRHLVRVLVPNPNQWCCFRLIPLPIAYNYGDVNLIISPGPPAHLVGYYGRRVIIIIVVGGD